MFREKEVCVEKCVLVKLRYMKFMSVKKIKCRKGVVLGEVHGDMCTVLVNRFMEVRGSLGREIFVDLEICGKRSFCRLGYACEEGFELCR